jgi:hypothetical protein
MSTQARIRRTFALERSVVLAALVYYWAYLYLRVLMAPPEESPLSYVATVLPISLFASIGLLLHLLRSPQLAPAGSGFSWLLAFGAASAGAAAANLDPNTFLAAGLMTLALLWLVTAPAAITLRLLNALLLASIVFASLFYAAGWSDYGVLPGQYAEGADRGIAWRVSLFPYVPESGFFALVVLVANQLRGKGASRVVFGSTALYFLVFSGVRSALLCWLLCLALMLWNRRLRNRSRALRVRGRLAASTVLIVGFVISVFASTLLQFFPELAQGFLGSYVFRTAADDVSAESITQSVYRSWLWLHHLDIFFSAPLFGAGSYDFTTLVDESLIEGHVGTGSESFFTLWLSRVGLCFVPLVAFLVATARRAAADESLVALSCFLALMVAGLAYGSFLVPYNFMFILLFALLGVRQRRAPRVREFPAAPQRAATIG